MKRIAPMGVLILAVNLTLGTPARAAIFRLGHDVIPVSQVIELKLDPRLENYQGTTRIDLDVKNTVSSFHLHAESLDIQSLLLSRDGKRIECRFQPEDSATLRVELAQKLDLGPLVLEIGFANNFERKAQGLFNVEVGGESYAFTQFEEDDARKAFPCFDEPAFKFPYQLVLTVPEAHLALANTPIESEQTRDGWRTVRFRKSPPVPSYLLALAAGPLDTVSLPGLGVPARVVTTRGKVRLASLAVKLTPPILKALEDYFGTPYPYEKLDLIGVPEFWPGAMENPGAIMFAEGVLLVDSAQVGVGSRRDMAVTIAHELAHMWFGDLVTMAWWDDLWLNESFAEWLGEKIAHQVYPELGIDISSVQSLGRTMDGDARPSAKAIRQPVTSSDLTGNLGPIYAKGRAVLGMFEQYLGEETFRRSIQTYLGARAWASATAADLWSALRKEAGWDVGAAMATFIDQPGIPLVSFAAGPSGQLRVSQKRFSNYGVEVPQRAPWHIPLAVRYTQGGQVKEQAIVLSQPEMTLELGADGVPLWIMPNGDARAYCRWTVPYDRMLALAHSAETTLTARERVGLLGNLDALLNAGVVSGDEYLELVAGFRHDPHPQVISAVAGAVAGAQDAFIADSLRPLFAAYVRRTLGPALDRIGLQKQSGEDETVTELRPRLVSRLADEGRDSTVQAYMTTVFHAFMSGDETVDPELRSLSLQLACHRGDRALFDSCKARFERSQTPAERDQYLSALGAFRDSALQEAALQYALAGPLQPQELWDIPNGIASESEAQSDRILQWFLDHYDELVNKMPPMYRAYLPMIASGCSLARLERARAFFTDPAHSTPGVVSRLARVSDAVHECVSLRTREGGKVAAYLARTESGSSLPAGKQ